MATYRAAYIGETVLTSAEHAELTDSELREEAFAEAVRAGLIDQATDDESEAFPRLTVAAFNAALVVGDWAE